ncbi:hypothetical protein HXX76_000629 [Chlamydomonas incerta]|uniref:Uncharacterized protein n=1 Tax=Chlamydomonas incerta TaxID=51695 RepID=A0A835WEN3_CHLIN|nr:hypothetical protein HXX76_000629 [Chlamydomonas incerta]|eukprot:KAG2446027.1 hypothetical protein HXX76_000629 [Chlamydomonas incerta]
MRGRVGALMKENQLLGRLLQELQAKLECSESEVISLDAELGKREEDLLRMDEQLAQCKQEAQEANQQLGSCRAHVSELEQQLADVGGRLADRETACEALQRRLAQAEGELRRLRENSVSGQDVSQQLQRVESLYRTRVEALQREAAEQLAAQDAAARQRLAEAQAATAAALARVKRGALHEVQRAEAFMESRVRDLNRVLEQLQKRCLALEARAADLKPLAAAAAAARQRAAELDELLAAAEEAAAGGAGGGCCGSCCCCSCAGAGGGASRGGDAQRQAVTDLQKRIVDLRSDALRDCEVIVQLQADLVAAQRGSVAAAERAEAVEAACQSLRAENAAMRKTLLTSSAVRSNEAAREASGAGEGQDLAAAQATALAAVESEAACVEALRSAQREAAAAQRALLAQVRRMHTLESMRLADVQVSWAGAPAARGGEAGGHRNASRRIGSGASPTGIALKFVSSCRPTNTIAASAWAFFSGDDGGARDPVRRMLDGLRDVKPASDAGRPSRRGNPLGDYNALLSSYKGRKMEELLGKTEVDLAELQTRLSQAWSQADMGVKLSHPHAAGMALLSPELAVAEYKPSALPASHLACLGEQVMHLATMELAWSAMEQSIAAAEAVSAAGPDAGGSTGPPPVAPIGIDAKLMHLAAKEVEDNLPQLLVERWKVLKHVRYRPTDSNQRPAKKELANAAKALLAVLYLDGGYAEAVRPALAPLVAEVLLRPRSGSDSEDSKAAVSGPPTESPLDVLGQLLEQALVSRPPGQRQQPLGLNLPRGKDDLHQHGGEVSREVKLLAECLAWALGPLLLSLESFEENYGPRHVPRFVELSALWYSYLHAMPPPPARGAPMSRSWAGLARCSYLSERPGAAPAAADAINPPLPHAIATSTTAPAALLALGREVYRVAVVELLLEREATHLGEGSKKRLELGFSKPARGRASDRIRKELARLCDKDQRTLQMRALVPELRRDKGDPAMAARLPKCVYGVLGAVMLEGGLKHARAVARRLVEVVEVPDAAVALERVHEEATARYRHDV